MDIARLKKLIKLFEGSQISELELEQEGWRVLMKKGGGEHIAALAQVHPHIVAPSAPKTDPSQAGGEAQAPESKYHVIKSPMVGTFYRSSSPTSPPFIEVGDEVRKGDVLCIIEAMKLMNEIDSEISGKIVKILPENGKPVEFGEPLFEIDPA